MKRPLFWVCIALAVLAACNLLWSRVVDFGGKIPNGTQGSPPGDGPLVFSGRVAGKERQGSQEYFFLTDLSYAFDQNVYSASGALSAEDAARSRQVISQIKSRKTDRIQCFLAADDGQTMPKIGSRVTVSGEFSYFYNCTNPGEFDSARYWQSRRVGGKLEGTRVLVCSAEHDRIKEALYALRTSFGDRLERAFPAREAGVMRAMLLGDRTGLDTDLKEIYQDGGILHILSISGLHVTLLGIGLFEMLRRMGLRLGGAAVLAGCVMLLYGIMTGMSVSACRAIGMFLIRMLAQVVGRTADLLTSAGVMLCGMLCLLPAYGLGSGFWLSYGSIFGIGVLLPVFEKALEDERSRAFGKRLGQGLCAGGSVFLATLPLTLLFYYEVSTYSLLLNLLVIPAMSVVIFLGFVVMVIPGLSLLAWPDVLLLRLFEVACKFVRTLPFAVWNPGCPRAWQIIGYYVLLGLGMALLWHFAKRREERPRSGTAQKISLKKKLVRGPWPGIAGLALAFLLLALPTRRLTGLGFLDVGQGDCVLLRLSNGQCWLYDCGSTTRRNVGENVLLAYLKHEGIRRLDGVFVSHADRDHLSGIIELFALAGEERIWIDALYLPFWQEGYEDLLALCGEGLPVRFLKAGDELCWKKARFTVLHPQSALGPNEGSLCLLWELQTETDFTALLTGDVQGEGERELIGELERRGIHEVTVLKCAHHGSKNATSQEFLDVIDAKLTVISCGRNNSYAHPNEELLLRLSEDHTKILRTDENGAIEIWSGFEKTGH